MNGDSIEDLFKHIFCKLQRRFHSFFQKYKIVLCKKSRKCEQGKLKLVQHQKEKHFLKEQFLENFSFG